MLPYAADAAGALVMVLTTLIPELYTPMVVDGVAVVGAGVAVVVGIGVEPDDDGHDPLHTKAMVLSAQWALKNSHEFA